MLWTWALSHVQPHGLCPTRLSMEILQARILERAVTPSSMGIFPTQGSNPGLLHCRRTLYQLSYMGSHSGSVPGLGSSPGEGLTTLVFSGFPGGSDSKESTCNVGDLGSIPGLERSLGGGQGNPLQYSCLENPHRQRSLAGYIQSMGS